MTIETDIVKGVHGLFERQVDETPDSVAVIFEKDRLTYGELDRRSNQLGHYLRDFGVCSNVLVGIFLDRSVDMVVALLGVFKAGGAYVPLDPEYPSDRLKYMLDHSQAPIVITQQALRRELPDSDARILFIDSDWRDICELDHSRPDNPVDPLNLAYVIYTSGSTGKPKGVKIQHGAVVNFLASMAHEPGLTAEDVLVAVSTLSFDISVLELFLPLTVGAIAVIADRITASDGQQLLELLNKSSATMMQATPSTWRMLVSAGWQGSKAFSALCGGEALPPDLQGDLVKRASRAWNMYGPTETTIWSTCYELTDLDEQVLIGRPIANTQVYILGPNMEPVPIGVEGELFIGGAGVSLGYLHQGDFTRERFLRDPFSNDPGARIYRTGDLVRYHADGNIEYRGQMDNQVKIRGFRIELGEIESVLNQHPLVSQGVAAIKEEQPGDMRLVAYIVPEFDTIPSVSSLRDHLGDKLPDYMIPQHFVTLQDLPLTPNGKINRMALPGLKQADVIAIENYTAPRTEEEALLVTIWRDLLKIDKVGIRDNFFEIGGHSLLAARMFSKIKVALGVNLPLATLIQAPTIEFLANEIKTKVWSKPWSSLVAIQPGGTKPPLFCVHGAGGNVLLYRDLAEHLGPEQPLYGLQAQGLDGKQDPYTRFEDMAAHHIGEIRAFQPYGPYYLAGYCLGGAIAYEMAQQLSDQGQKTALLVMFETYNANFQHQPVPFFHRLYNPIENLMFHWRNFFPLRMDEKQAYFFRKTGAFLRRLRVRTMVRLSSFAAKLKMPFGRDYPHVYLTGINDEAHAKYVPKVYEGHLTMFRPKRHYIGFEDPEFGWGGLAKGGLDIHEIQVNPRGMMVEPFVRELARKLRNCIQEATKHRA